MKDVPRGRHAVALTAHRLVPGHEGTPGPIRIIRAMPRPRSSAAVSLGLVLVAIAPVLLAGCTSQGAEQQVSGVILSVRSTSPTETEGFTLRTRSGEQLEFRVGQLDLTEGGFAAGHLREHQATAQEVIVRFRTEGGTRVATKLTDPAP